MNGESMSLAGNFSCLESALQRFSVVVSMIQASGERKTFPTYPKDSVAEQVGEENPVINELT